MEPKRILSGMRPTGKLHLGHLHGALKNWVDLQESGKYDCFYFVADWHAITSEYSSTEGIKDNAINMVIDWLERRSRSSKEHSLRAISGQGACRVVFTSFHDYSAGMA